jgi:glycosyltransferase involved in cell wall biosynthesis
MESLRIAWVGRLDQAQKRVHDLAPILMALDAQATPFHLSIAGDGPERSTLLKLLAPWIETGQVSVLGSIPRQDLARRVYGSHDALLITSAWETGPIVAWEAMAAGMAVVSSRYVGSGVEGALQHDRTALLFKVGDASQAAIQLGRLQNAARLRELARAGRDLVERRYSREASLAAWMAAFETVATRPSLPAPQQDVPIASAGGLDRRLGPQTAERVRRILGRRFRHGEAGSEWPHSGHGASQATSLLAMASELDQGSERDG